MDTLGNTRKKLAVVFENNEIVLNAVRKVLEGLGYEVRRDVESARHADIGFVGAYFALLGVVHQLRQMNALLPLVLIVNSDQKLCLQSAKDFYDIIHIQTRDQGRVRDRVARWFSEGQGRFLSNKRRPS